MPDKPLPSRTRVLIVGAGPAGLAAALVLGRAGVDAVLVEAKDRIGPPLRCGEMTRPEFFDSLGVEARPAWVRWRLAATGQLVLDRPRMEEELAGMARGLGVRVQPGASLAALGPFDGQGRDAVIQQQGNRVAIRAGCVIAADGVASATARLAGLSTRLPLERVASCVGRVITGARVVREDCMFVKPLPPPHPSPPYYFWAIPNGRGRINVGLGIMGVEGSRARFLLDRMIASREAFSGGRPGPAFCGLMPMMPPLDPPLADGLLVTGTAARITDPIGGIGLLPAVQSGRAAAETLVSLGDAPAGAIALMGYPERISTLLQLLQGRWRDLESGRAGIPGGPE